ncbi:hypothetical protein FRC08_008043 [Ceratobasidium sp. 394]|nr:hypothetical protein FRC08_008043 [Ceratobasidium sp. 394]
MSSAQEAGTSDEGILHFMRDYPPMADPACPPKGTPQSTFDEMANEAKATGDVFYKEEKWREARDAYARGAELQTSDPELRKKILLNLAAADLQLGNLNDVLRSTSTVLSVDPDSVKALYRSAHALYELNAFEQAVDCCDRALKLEPYNRPLQKVSMLARHATTKIQGHLLLCAYEYYHMYIVPTSRMGLPTTHPHEIPFFDPPIPSNPLEAPMFCYLRFRYIERHASDTVSEFPTDKPILPLLETLLPGTTTFPTPSRTWNNLTFVPMGLETNITHPTSWDPQHEFLPSTLSVYARTRRGGVIPIKNEMSLADMFAEARRLSIGQREDDGTHIELRRGMVHLFTFRNGSEAEERWHSGEFKDPVELGDPDNTTNLRARQFCYGDPKGRSTNLPTSPSWVARDAILEVLHKSRGDEGKDSTD